MNFDYLLIGQLYAFQIPPCVAVEPTPREKSPDTIHRRRKLSELTKATEGHPTENNITASPTINGIFFIIGNYKILGFLTNFSKFVFFSI